MYCTVLYRASFIDDSDAVWRLGDHCDAASNHSAERLRIREPKVGTSLLVPTAPDSCQLILILHMIWSLTFSCARGFSGNKMLGAVHHKVLPQTYLRRRL